VAHRHILPWIVDLFPRLVAEPYDMASVRDRNFFLRRAAEEGGFMT
jgi:hypothetical protein